MEERFTNKTMYEIVHQNAIESPNVTAVYYQKKKISFREFDRLVLKTAEVLERKLSVRRGDVITIALPNIPNALILLYACNRLGAICNMVHPLTPFNQMKVILDQSHSKWAFVFEQRVAKEIDKYRSIADTCYVCRIEDYLPLLTKGVYHVFMNFAIRKKLKRTLSYPRYPGFKYFYQLKGKASREPSYVKGEGKIPALLLHSGSTTGDPKTICLSNDNLNFIASKAPEEMSLPPEELVGKGMLSFLPTFHGFGLGMTMHLPLSYKFTSVLIPKFNAKSVIEAMNHTPVNAICGVPTAYEHLLNSEEFRKCAKIKNLHCAWSGGDSLPVTVSDEWKKVMESHGSHCELFEGYGLTESVAAIVVNTFGHHKRNSLGYPLEGVEIGIFQENGKKAKPRTIGEIAVKSPSNMICYFGDPTATDKAVKDGYVYSGDLGYIDEDGFVFFSSRKKRVVKVSGVGVFPSEIEHLVETIPGVKKVAAIRIPDERLQSAIKIIVVTDLLDKEGLRQQIMETCCRYLIRWSVPKEIEFRDDLPLTLYNKTDFRKLQAEEDAKRGLK